MIEDRLRRLKLRVPAPDIEACLAPAEDQFAACREAGRQDAPNLPGRAAARTIDIAGLA